MLPLNCNVKHRLQKHDDISINIEDTIYSIKIYMQNQWIVMLDFPSELTTIHKMAMHTGLDQTDIAKQVRLFYRKLEELLEMSNEADENQTRWELIAFNHDKLKSTSDTSPQWSGLQGFLKNVVLQSFDSGSSGRNSDENDPRRDDLYWTSRKNSLELIELSSINKVSLV